VSFGHFADSREHEGPGPDGHPLWLRDTRGWTIAELVGVDDRDMPTYRMLESKDREWEQVGIDLGPCDPIDEDDDAYDAAISAEFDRATESASLGNVSADEDALFADLMRRQAKAAGLYSKADADAWDAEHDRERAEEQDQLRADMGW
jgi:hypothetical protein